MSFWVYMTNYAKPVNHTGRVAQTDMNGFHGDIKSDCSVLNPVITLNMDQFSDDRDITKFNWAFIPRFHRYYWITDIKYVLGLWEFSMKVDVMATYRDAIASSNLYVLRSSAAYNGDVIDTLYPIKTGCDVDKTSIGTFWEQPGSHADVGAYIIGVVSTGGQYGTITYYALSRTGMISLINNLMTNSIITANGFDVDDASLALQKSLIDPLSYIKSCVYIPINISDLSVTAQTGLQIYDYNFSSTPCYAVNSLIARKSATITKPIHPDTASRGNYVNCAPYTLLTLNIPPFGLIELDTSVTCDVSSITAFVTVDLATGIGRLEVECGRSTNTCLLTSVEAQVGVPITLSQVTRDYVGAAQSIFAGIGSALSGNFLGIAAGVGSVVESMRPHMTSVGTNGNFAGLTSVGTWNLTAQFYRPVEDDNTHHGRPLCANRTLSTIPGYIVVQDGDIPIPIATAAEVEEVKQYLESGFYMVVSGP